MRPKIDSQAMAVMVHLVRRVRSARRCVRRYKRMIAEATDDAIRTNLQRALEDEWVRENEAWNALQASKEVICEQEVQEEDEAKLATRQILIAIGITCNAVLLGTLIGRFLYKANGG
jgi:hypothetical protein